MAGPGAPTETAAGCVFDGLVLAGGRGRRLGGPGKPQLEVGGRRMIDVVRAALVGARSVTVVGPGADVVEEPPGGGPVAAIATGLASVTAPLVVVLAADLPFVTAAVVRALVDAAPATAVDDEGRAQYLLGAFPTAALRAALPDDPDGARVGDVVRSLMPQGIRFDQQPPPWWDCDTAEQLRQARRWS
jgi:molybdopterin-guanine dinucleotide biosynthesis protein A